MINRLKFKIINFRIGLFKNNNNRYFACTLLFLPLFFISIILFSLIGVPVKLFAAVATCILAWWGILKIGDISKEEMLLVHKVKASCQGNGSRRLLYDFFSWPANSRDILYSSLKDDGYEQREFNCTECQECNANCMNRCTFKKFCDKGSGYCNVNHVKKGDLDADIFCKKIPEKEQQEKSGKDIRDLIIIKPGMMRALLSTFKKA